MKNSTVKECGEKLVRAGLHEAEGADHIAENDLKRLDRFDSGCPDRELQTLILEADEVTIDFSEWPKGNLNIKSTCRFFGIGVANLKFKGYKGTEEFRAQGMDRQRLVLSLYKWCRGLAKLSTNKQRKFHFINGMCVDEGRAFPDRVEGNVGATLPAAIIAGLTAGAGGINS